MYSLDYFESREWDLKEQYGGWGEEDPKAKAEALKRIKEKEKEEILEKVNQSLPIVEEMNKQGQFQFLLERGEIVPVRIDLPRASHDGMHYYSTYETRSLNALNAWHDCEYATTDKGCLLRKQDISEYWYSERDMISLIRKSFQEKRKSEIRNKCTFMLDVYAGNEALNVPCFKSVDHPAYRGWTWALLDDMCYHVKWNFDRCVEALDESFPAISLDELYSF